jgi:hypothetical protein
MSIPRSAGQAHPVMVEAIEAWLQAEFPNTHAVTQTYECAGTSISVSQTGSFVENELRAFSKSSPNIAGLKVFARETQARFPFQDLSPVRPGVLAAQLNGRYFISVEAEKGNLFVFDSHQRQAYWAVKPSRPEWHVSSPLRQILHIDVALREGGLLHGAMIGDGKKSVVLTGPSHAGKSTATAWAVAEGFLSGGDDYVCISRGNSSWNANPVYKVIKLRDSSPALGSIDSLEHTRIEKEGRSVFYLEKGRGLLGPEAVPIHAILTLGPPDQSADFQKISPPQALAKLAPSTLLQSVFFEKQLLETLTNFSTAVPAVQIRRPSQSGDLAKILSAILMSDQASLRS